MKRAGNRNGPEEREPAEAEAQADGVPYEDVASAEGTKPATRDRIEASEPDPDPEREREREGAEGPEKAEGAEGAEGAD